MQWQRWLLHVTSSIRGQLGNGWYVRHAGEALAHDPCWDKFVDRRIPTVKYNRNLVTAWSKGSVVLAWQKLEPDMVSTQINCAGSEQNCGCDLALEPTAAGKLSLP